MKKIYMILAAVALLTMSLNAQLISTQKVAKHAATTGKVDTPPEGMKKVPRLADFRAPSRAVETTTVTFLPEYSSSTVRTKTIDGVTLTITGGDLGYSDAMRLSGTITLSTTAGNITQIVFDGGNNTSYPVTRLSTSTGNYTTSNNVGTWTGSASSISFTASNQVRCTSIVVTVETESGGGSTETATLNLFDTTMYVAQVLPVYGYWFDAAQHNQMIYPASMLTSMIGKKIKSMTFYPASYNNYSGINFYNGSVTFKLTEVTGSTGFNSNSPSLITGTMTTVKTVTMPTSANTSATTWLIQFDQEYKYNGGDLVIDVTTTAGDYGYTYFYIGTTASLNVAYPGYLSYNSNTSAINYVPMVTFTYEQETVPQHDLSIALSAPTKVGAGNTVTVTATVTNTGDFDENGYTVTFTDGTNTYTQTATTALQVGESTTFTATFPTNANAGGQTVNYTATVACTDDVDATNNTATASTALITLPPPENVQATTGDNQSATMTWDAPTTTPATINEGFDDTSEFPSFSIGGITASVHTGTIGGWTVYTPSSDYVYAPQNSSFTNMQAPQAWTVMNPTAANWNIDTPHSGSQFMLSFCDSGDENFQNIQTTDHYLISPELSGDAQTITFWERVITTQYGNETYEVLASSTDNNPASFSVVQSFTSGQTTWTQRSVTLPAGTKYFAIRHTSYDIFGVMIDDVTYVAAPIEPVSYNIYLDGVLVGNVPSTTFSYPFNNLSLGEHQCAVSAVYDGGFESVAVPATFTIQNKTDAPVITADTTATTVVITATATDPNASVTLTIGNQTVTNTGSASITINRTDTDQTVTATATAQETGKQESDPTTEQIGIPALPQTAAPVITWERVGDNIVITATGNGTVNLSAGGQTASGTGSASITIPCGADTQTVTATATAQETNHLISQETTETITIPYIETAPPVITVSEPDANGNVTVTATGAGNVTLTIDGQTVNGNGSASITLPAHLFDYTVTAEATAQESGKHVSTTTTRSVTVPGIGGSGWLPMDGTFTGDQALTFIDEATGKRITFTDAFSRSTEKNDHPDEYNYVLREPGTDHTSNTVPVPVHKTYSTMQGLYTKQEVDDDTLMTLTANAINSKMVYDIHTANEMYFYALQRGAIGATYPDLQANRISQLQESNDLFTEQLSLDVFPRYNNQAPGTVMREDRIFDGAVGNFGDEIAYVPVIWTMGYRTGRVNGDYNTYGSDIKRETLGSIGSLQIAGSRSGTNNQENTGNGWEGIFKVDGVPYCVYTPVITIQGNVPAEKVQKDGDVSSYEPYMYRAWCMYEGARDFTQVNGILTDAGELPIPYLLGTDVINSGVGHIGYEWTGGPRLQWAFGVPSAEQPENVPIVVRFYYKKTVRDAAQNSLRGNRDGEEEPDAYYIVEMEGSAQGIGTAINEFYGGKTITSVTYVNAQGMTSSKPFSGLNIVVTRYSDGTTSTTKVMR